MGAKITVWKFIRRGPAAEQAQARLDKQQAKKKRVAGKKDACGAGSACALDL